MPKVPYPPRPTSPSDTPLVRERQWWMVVQGLGAMVGGLALGFFALRLLFDGVGVGTTGIKSGRATASVPGLALVLAGLAIFLGYLRLRAGLGLDPSGTASAPSRRHPHTPAKRRRRSSRPM